MLYHRESTKAFHRFLCLLGIATLALAMSCSSGHNDVFYNEVLGGSVRMYNAGMRTAAKQYLDSVFKANLGGSPHFRVETYKNLAHWAYLDNKYDTCRFMLDSELMVIEQYKLQKSHRREYIDALNDRGIEYSRDNDLNKAFECYSLSREMAYGTGDECSYVAPTYALGMVTYKQKKYNDAVKFFHEAYTLNNKCPWTIYVFFKNEELLLNIGLAYTNLGSYDSARKYYTAAKNTIDSAAILFPADTDATNFQKEATGVIKGNLAKVLIEQGENSSAMELLKENIAANDKHGRDMKDAMFSRIRLAELYYQTGNYQGAIGELKELQHRLDSIPDNEIRSRTLHLLFLYHKKMGDAVAAGYFDRYQALRDSMELSANALNKVDYAALLKDKDTQFRIALLTRDNEVNRLYLGVALLLSMLAVIIILFVFRSYYRSRKNVVALTALNRQVNEQKQALEDAMDQLRETSSAKDRILHVVAHDLRNPVSGIITLAPMMTAEKLTGTQQEMMDLITAAAGSAMALIDEILLYSDIASQKLAVEKTDANRLAAQAAALLQLKANSKDQKIIVSGAHAPVYVLANKEKMARVLGNLLANAIKFSPHDTRIEILVSATEAHVTIRITDHGIGIPTTQLPYIFDLFTRSKRHGTDGEASFGLGLSICRQIVTAHNGTISVESTEGVGSSFLIQLPGPGNKNAAEKSADTF